MSEVPFDGQCGDDEGLLGFITQEDLSGRFLKEERLNEELTGKDAVAAIWNQGSHPLFFGMDEEGNNANIALLNEDNDE